MNKIVKNLTFWVLIAITFGILFGAYYPKEAVNLKISFPDWKDGGLFWDWKTLGDAFITIVKLFINPIIFLTITVGIAAMGDLKKVGKTGGKALIYFEIVTTIALLIGIAVAYIIQPGTGVDTTKAIGADISKYVKNASTFSWAKFFMENLTLQVLVFSLVSGMILGRWEGRKAILDPLSNLSKYIFKALHIVMYLAPIGAFGGMAFTIGKFGTTALFSLGKLMLSVYVTMAVFIFIGLGLILKMYNIRIWDYLKYIKEELLIVLGTSSSEAALPALMEKLERMGCEKSVVGLVVPAGYSFNLDGTTIYLSMACIFLAQAYGVHLSWEQVASIIGILMVTSKGAAGVTGSGFIVLASTLQAVQAIPVEGLALLLGVDRFMSEARALTNFIGNGVATIWIANNEKAFDRSKMNTAFYAQNDTVFANEKILDTK
jgi:aerobic C4-dicarboxylate transport protein